MSAFDEMPEEAKDEAYQLKSMAFDDLAEAIEGMNKFQALAYISSMMDVSINALSVCAPKEFTITYLEEKLKAMKEQP